MLRSLAIVAGLLVGLAIPSAANAYTAYSKGVNVRSGPGVKYHKVGYLPRGRRVQVYFCRYGWCQINFNYYRAWVAENFLTRSYRRYLPPPPRYVPPRNRYYPRPPPPRRYRPPPPLYYPY